MGDIFKDATSIYYSRDEGSWTLNKREGIVNKLCFLDTAELYNEKHAYTIMADKQIGDKLYTLRRYALHDEVDIILYESIYPHLKIHYLGKEEENLYDLKEKTIINMYKFTIQYQTALYEEDIEILKNTLTERELSMLELKVDILRRNYKWQS